MIKELALFNHSGKPVFIIILLLTALIAFLLTPQIKKLAFRLGAVDEPDERKVHTVPMPRLGGLAVFLAFICGVILLLPLNREIKGLLLSSSFIVLLGAIDDIVSLPPLPKMIGQITAAVMLCLSGVQVHYVTNPFSDHVLQLGWLSIPITVFWIVLVTNAFNLIDGLDGLAGGVAVIAGLTLALTAFNAGHRQEALCALILVMAVAGFLPYNFHPAKIFMGDSGSMLLGFVLSALAIMGMAKGVTLLSVLVPIIILGVPLLDTLFAVIRRLREHKPMFAPDKEHIHHRLLAIGLSHKQSVLVIYLIDIIFSLLAIMSTMLTAKQTYIMMLGVLVVVLLLARKIGILGVLSNKRKGSSDDRQSG